MINNKSLDGYEVYQIVKENRKYFLADERNYKSHIDELINNLDGLKFDSLIILFGLDTGEYLLELEKYLCSQNRVIIFEPNEDVFEESKKQVLDDRVSIALYDERIIRTILSSLINLDNYDNLYVYAFGNYKEIYKEEYDYMIQIISDIFFEFYGSISLAYNWREAFMENSISNLKSIKNSSTLNSYVNFNKDIPAIIVSAGPSLDINIKELLKNKDKIKNYFIIASNRTFKTLIMNGIQPDAVVSIDPSEAMYDMMKDNLNSSVPLLYYEYSNRTLVEYYKGEKIFMSSIFSKVIEEMSNYIGLGRGGSVAHTCIEIADTLGCNPIILIGQDFAYTFDKHHSDNSIFDIDKVTNAIADLSVTDVFGKKVITTLTLNMFKKTMEYNIELYKDKRNVEFINASYGAEIKGAPHKSLEDIFNDSIIKNNKRGLVPTRDINLDDSKVIETILNFINIFIEKSNQGIEQCTILKNLKNSKSLIDSKPEDIDLQRFLFAFDIVKTFEKSLEGFYLGGYFNGFLYSIKRESFSLLAKNYDKLTSDMKYQGEAFLSYFTKMNEMLNEAKDVILEVISE